MSRQGKLGYQDRLLVAAELGLGTEAGLSDIAIKHDLWCRLYRGLSQDCNCVPDIFWTAADGRRYKIFKNGHYAELH